jgi:hypothetical protein
MEGEGTGGDPIRAKEIGSLPKEMEGEPKEIVYQPKEIGSQQKEMEGEPKEIINQPKGERRTPKYFVILFKLLRNPV